MGPRVLVIGCGAIARELLDIVERNRLGAIDVECLPAVLHNRPSEIPSAVAARLERATGRYDSIYVAYADCGTGGLLDAVLQRYEVERLPGAHCYEFYATSPVFAAMHDDNPATFYLTDYLVRHFERLVWIGLGLDRHPELLTAYFGNYERVVYLAQSTERDLEDAARAAAERLGLEYEYRLVGMGDLETALVSLPNPRVA